MATKGFEYVPGLKANLESKGWWHSFELPDGRRIEGVNTVDSLRKRIELHTIPQDLSGARVLDIGAWDGWYSFEMERRGAQVLAIDCWDNPHFHQIRAALKSRVEYRQMDVYELNPQTVGRFDIVLFMGVLYHLKHPLLGLEKVCAITTGMAVVDSFILREEHLPGALVETRPVMEFYETDEFGGQTDNWCGPSLPCLRAMCRTAGFACVQHRAIRPNGACISCYRQWEPVSEQAMRCSNFQKAP
jgi:tRNA (mo5U34)-methyltransferase